MKAFLPERRIASLALTWMPNPNGAFDNSNFDSLSRSLKEVKFLSWGGFCGRPSLDLLCLHLQSLEVLELVGLHDITVRLKVISGVHTSFLTNKLGAFVSFRASELEDTYHFRNVAKLAKSDGFGGTGRVFPQIVFDLQAPGAYRTVRQTPNISKMDSRWDAGPVYVSPPC
jgi:hypothetical protein